MIHVVMVMVFVTGNSNGDSSSKDDDVEVMMFMLEIEMVSRKMMRGMMTVEAVIAGMMMEVEIVM